MRLQFVTLGVTFKNINIFYLSLANKITITKKMKITEKIPSQILSFKHSKT